MAVGEWDERQLCPDGTCVGVIGPDGTCKVCGRVAPNWGDERNRGLLDPPDDEDEGEDEDEDDDDELAADDDSDGDDSDGNDGDEDYVGDDEDEGEGEADEAGPAGGASSGRAPAPHALAAPSDWGSRHLCPDGACIGVIGADGRCKVCGRRASDAPTTGGGPRTSAPQDAPNPEGGDAAAEPASVPKPCSDAGCAGVAGAGGTCTVCGKLVP